MGSILNIQQIRLVDCFSFVTTKPSLARTRGIAKSLFRKAVSLIQIILKSVGKHNIKRQNRTTEKDSIDEFKNQDYAFENCLESNSGTFSLR